MFNTVQNSQPVLVVAQLQQGKVSNLSSDDARRSWPFQRRSVTYKKGRGKKINTENTIESEARLNTLLFRDSNKRIMKTVRL